MYLLTSQLGPGSPASPPPLPPPQTRRTKVPTESTATCRVRPRASTLGQAWGASIVLGAPAGGTPGPLQPASAAASTAATLSCAAAAACRMLITGTMRQRKSGRSGTMSRPRGLSQARRGSRKDLQVPGARLETALWRGR